MGSNDGISSTKNSQWISCDKDYIFKVQVLGSLFRGKFLAYLKHEFSSLNTNFNSIQEFNKFLEPLYNKTWITYIEPPKGKAENVIEYVDRYSFRVAISNERIKNIIDGKVTFEIKHYGLLSNRNKKNNIRFCKLLISKILTNEFVSTISRKFHEFKCEKCGSTSFSYLVFFNIISLNYFIIQIYIIK